MNNQAAPNRRNFSKRIAGAGLALLAAQPAVPAQPAAKTLRMRITKVEPIMTGSDVFLKIETDAGITGYGDGTQHFLPYAAEGTLKDVIPYLVGEDPER